MSMQVYHIFTKAGDARRELDALVRDLGVSAPAEAGLHKSIFVTRANQTVAFLTGRDTVLARALRGRPGWVEPEAPA